MAAPGSRERVKVPSQLPGDVWEWDEDAVKKFLMENKTEYRLKEEDIEIIRMNGIDGVLLFDVTAKELEGFGLNFASAKKIIQLFHFLKGPVEAGK